MTNETGDPAPTGSDPARQSPDTRPGVEPPAGTPVPCAHCAQHAHAETPKQDRQPSRTQTIVAVGVIVVYIGSLGLMFGYRGDPYWDRMVLLLSALDALLLPAVALLLGAALGREYADRARKETRDARAGEQKARDRALVSEQLGTSGRALAQAVKTSFSHSAAPGSPVAPGPPAVPGHRPRPGSGTDRGGSAARGGAEQANLALLAALAESLFPSES